MKNESVAFLKNYVKNDEELNKYGEKMAKLCDYLPISLSNAGRIWSCIETQFYEDVQEFIEYIESPGVFAVIQSTNDFVLEERIRKYFTIFPLFLSQNLIL